MTVHVTSAALSFGADEVLSDVSFILRPRDRVALVGRNGAGKTTLLRMLAGELSPDRGEIAIPSGTRVALHDQRPPLATATTLGEYVGAGAAEASRLEEELRGLEAQMAAGDAGTKVLGRYEAAQRRFERAGGYGWRARLEAVARGLGFTPDDLGRPLRSFSGGELTRASLTRALAAEPDVLLLDEPTNHLDTDAIEWLEEHLDSLDASVLLVSHDRWFLESVATGVLEIDRGKGRYDKGSYSHWRALKAERLASAADAWERQQAGAGPPAAVRRPLSVRHQEPPGAEQAEGHGPHRAGRKAIRPALAALPVSAAGAQWAGGVRGRGRGSGGGGADAPVRRLVRHRTRPAGGPAGAQRRGQDHASGDALGPPRATSREAQAGAQRDRRLLLAAVAGAARLAPRDRGHHPSEQPDRAAGARPAGPLPVLR